jgi:hypothetical protein
MRKKGLTMLSINEIQKFPVKVWTLSNGWTIIGRYYGEGARIWHPFRLIPNQKGGLSVAAILAKEKYLDVVNWEHFLFELEVLPEHEVLLDKYEQILWGTLILPEEKRIII